jgi:hypothetical protein
VIPRRLLLDGTGRTAAVLGSGAGALRERPGRKVRPGEPHEQAAHRASLAVLRCGRCPTSSGGDGASRVGYAPMKSTSASAPQADQTTRTYPSGPPDWTVAWTSPADGMKELQPGA